MNGIISAGLGWIFAGFVSGAVWGVLLSHGINDYGMLAVTAIVLLTGTGMIAANKKIAAIRDSIIARRKKQ
ncbi:hypothetical protein M1567_02470 [Candidatus Marsarchaeota archaeon]|jgi:uncharacterized membrane protein YoaK (UPF0700 family)|nr:hypothetical protein [Candidatus Marsarchaeota archaeon]